MNNGGDGDSFLLNKIFRQPLPNIPYLEEIYNDFYRG